ncbi:hypothetical protein L6452_28325 [Arctium lappa]|uniref:Uncharacterized protein n=1 Tax=Arctium lappa TaxID=4217 RepID=A0ACB8ZZ48_ARCLA|nr:hypothetical protein L6452_28325 [Arctium lappa]
MAKTVNEKKTEVWAAASCLGCRRLGSRHKPRNSLFWRTWATYAVTWSRGITHVAHCRGFGSPLLEDSSGLQKSSLGEI